MFRFVLKLVVPVESTMKHNHAPEFNFLSTMSTTLHRYYSSAPGLMYVGTISHSAQHTEVD